MVVLDNAFPNLERKLTSSGDLAVFLEGRVQSVSERSIKQTLLKYDCNMIKTDKSYVSDILKKV